jgi:NAD(P)-dependent dehydrogenase (short-subunit alcohol dehydrogenase family)
MVDEHRMNELDVLSLADPSASWVTGQILAVDGGLGLT